MNQNLDINGVDKIYLDKYLKSKTKIMKYFFITFLMILLAFFWRLYINLYGTNNSLYFFINNNYTLFSNLYLSILAFSSWMTTFGIMDYYNNKVYANKYNIK